jgi:serine/threonine-protein kinase
MTNSPTTEPDPEQEPNFGKTPTDSSEIVEAIEACGFRLLKESKIGGQGIVLKMENASLERVVAVKLPLVLESFTDGFYEEAKTLAKLSHPNIVNIYSCGTAYSEASNRNFPYIEMEYIEGKSLGELLLEGRKFSERQSVEIIEAICLGLHEAHLNKIDHGDIKPDNILFRSHDFLMASGARPVPIIVDFGIARSSSSQSNSIAAGTPKYIAPEQRAGKPAHRTSDVYSVGKLFHELLTGTPGDGSNENEKLPTELRRIICKCCEQKPNERFASAKELSDELNRYSNNFPLRTVDTPFVRRAHLNLKRLHWWYAGIGTALLLVALGFYWNSNSRHADATDHQKELEGYAKEVTEIEEQLRGKANIQDAQLVLLERLEQKLGKSSQKWNDNHILLAKHARILNQCAKMYRVVGDLPTAFKRNKSATELLAAVNDTSETELLRALAITRQTHGLLLEDQQANEAASIDFLEMQRLFEIAKTRPDHMWSDWVNASTGAMNRAVALEQQGKLSEALDAYVRSRELLREKKEENAYYDEDLAFILNNEAPLYVEMGQHQKAIALMKQSAKIRRRLHKKDPTHQGRKFEHAEASMNCGIVIVDSVNARPDQLIDEDAGKYFIEAVKIYRELVEDNPKVLRYKTDLLKVACCEITFRYRAYAVEHGKDGPGLEVEDDIAEIVELSKGFELDGESTIGLSIFYLSAGRISKNKELIDTAVGQFEMMANYYPEMAELQQHLAWAYWEAEKFTAAAAGEEEFPIPERAAEKYGEAFRLMPMIYQYYSSYRRAIKDRIRVLEKSGEDPSAWKTKLAELEKAEPPVVANSNSAGQ